MKQRHILAILVAGAAAFGAASVSAAGPDPVNQATRTVDLNFGKNTTFAHDLVAASANFAPALADGNQLAHGAVSAGDAQPHTFAIKYSTVARNLIDGTGLKATISGSDNATNKLNTKLVPATAVTKDASGWLTYDNAVAYTSYDVVADGVQAAVATDTYTLSMDAAIWVA